MHNFLIWNIPCFDSVKENCNSQLSAVDVLAPASMKNAAKCDTLCELRYLVNHWNFERRLHFWDIPGSMLYWVSEHNTHLEIGGIWLCDMLSFLLSYCALLKYSFWLVIGYTYQSALWPVNVFHIFAKLSNGFFDSFCYMH